MVLDDIDFKILTCLQQDGRMSHTAIARLVELSSPAVTARVLRMERDGLIKGYFALLDAKSVGQQLLAFVRVRTGASDEDSTAFVQYARLAPEILECHDVDGEDSYLLKVRTDSTHALRDLIVRLRSFPDVTRTITSIVLKTIREEPLTAPLKNRVVDSPPSGDGKENTDVDE